MAQNFYQANWNRLTALEKRIAWGVLTHGDRLEVVAAEEEANIHIARQVLERLIWRAEKWEAGR